jgi:hypothetical protein
MPEDEHLDVLAQIITAFIQWDVDYLRFMQLANENGCPNVTHLGTGDLPCPEVAGKVRAEPL